MRTVPVFFVALFKTSDPTATIPSSAQRFARLYMYICVGSKMSPLAQNSVAPRAAHFACTLGLSLSVCRSCAVISTLGRDNLPSLKHSGYSEFSSRRFNSEFSTLLSTNISYFVNSGSRRLSSCTVSDFCEADISAPSLRAAAH
jgi:hypothetical protein